MTTGQIQKSVLTKKTRTKIGTNLVIPADLPIIEKKAQSGRAEIRESHKVFKVDLHGGAKKVNLLDFNLIFNSGGQERVDLIKRGVSAGIIDQFAKAMDTTKEHVIATLGLPRSTIQRKIKVNENLTIDQAERVVGLSKLLGQVETIVRESGDPVGFSAAKWLSHWLEEPNQAIGNRRPAEFMDTVTGQELISTLLAQMQSGAYA